jgi:hypothetical protein
VICAGVAALVGVVAGGPAGREAAKVDVLRAVVAEQPPSLR